MSALADLYQQVILDHARERHGFGLRERGAGARSGESRQVNPLCGDEVTVRVGLDDHSVADLSWDGVGCAISQAATSVLHDLVVGRPAEHARDVIDAYRMMIRSRGQAEPDETVLGDAVAFVGVGRHANRVKCAMLGWMALEEALNRVDDAQREQEES